MLGELSIHPHSFLSPPLPPPPPAAINIHAYLFIRCEEEGNCVSKPCTPSTIGALIALFKHSWVSLSCEPSATPIAPENSLTHSLTQRLYETWEGWSFFFFKYCTESAGGFRWVQVNSLVLYSYHLSKSTLDPTDADCWGQYFMIKTVWCDISANF